MFKHRSFSASIICGLMLASAIAWTPFVKAQGAANQISLVVPYAPGGPSDSTARLIRPVFERVLGKTTIVENIPGAGGSIGAAKVLRVTDGSQILIATPNEVILAPIGLAAVKYKADAFRLIGTVGELPFALVTRPDMPSRSLDDLVGHAMANPAKPLSYGSMGLGSMNHLATEALGTATGVGLTHIPYKGAMPLLQDLIGGQIDFALTPLAGNVQGLIETGKVKFLGITSAQRITRLKDWPTVNEGRQLRNFVYSIWFGPAVSKDTPDATVQRIQAALIEAMRQPDIQHSLAELGFVGSPVISTVDAEKLYFGEQKKFRSIADAMKLQPQ